MEDRQGRCYGVHVYFNRNWLQGGVWRIGKAGVMGTRIFQQVPVDGMCVEDRQDVCYGVHVYYNCGLLEAEQ